MMASTQKLDFLVARGDIARSRVRESSFDPEALAPGQVCLAVERFAFTANNISYASLGEALHYWRFFPVDAEWGLIPVWGFAQVLASRCDGVAVGERFYGYYPMSSHLLVEPQQLKTGNFVDGSAHRRELPALYNQYLRCSQDPLYSTADESLQMLLRPLFTTSFLLDDFLSDQAFFGASQLLLTSASSKTAIGTAFLLTQVRERRGQHYQVVGLTSAANRDFVERLGCYDRVLDYGQLAQLKVEMPSLIVDFAGNAALLAQLHAHCASGLRYSCRVGASHWDRGEALPTALPGPRPQLFFAPAQAEKRLQEWGGAGFQQRLAERWRAFTGFARQWLQIEHGDGPQAVAQLYRAMLGGQTAPDKGLILSLGHCPLG